MYCSVHACLVYNREDAWYTTERIHGCKLECENQFYNWIYSLVDLHLDTSLPVNQPLPLHT